MADDDLVHVEELLAPARDAAGGIWGLIGLNIEIGRAQVRRGPTSAPATLRSRICAGSRSTS